MTAQRPTPCRAGSLEICRTLAPFIASILALSASPASAGAWLRSEGEGFLATTIKVQDDADAKTYGTLYLEYGLNPDLTLGLDIGSDELGRHKALAFVLMPLARERLNVAFQLAAGSEGDEPAFRPGLSLGQGVTLGEVNGWWNVDTTARIAPGETILAIDATLGLAIWEETRLIGQLQQGGTLTDPDFLRLSAALVWPITARQQIEFGLSTGLIDAERFGVKLGLWRAF